MSAIISRLLRARRFMLITLATAVLVGGTFSLGQWQLRRAAQKQAWQAAVEVQSQRMPLDNEALLKEPATSELLHRPALLTGTWQAEHTVYLDNRHMTGKTGFVVLTPLLLQGSSQAIVVQRGWVPRNFQNRSALPAIATPTGVVSITGRITPPPSRLYQFSDVSSGLIRQNIDIEKFRAETGLPLLNLSLLQTDAASEGLLREWAAPNLGVDKHYGYAWQWFGLCGLVLVLYGWFQGVLPLRAYWRDRQALRSMKE